MTEYCEECKLSEIKVVDRFSAYLIFFIGVGYFYKSPIFHKNQIQELVNNGIQENCKALLVFGSMNLKDLKKIEFYVSS